MAFRNHRNKIRAKKAGGRMIGQTFHFRCYFWECCVCGHKRRRTPGYYHGRDCKCGGFYEKTGQNY